VTLKTPAPIVVCVLLSLPAAASAAGPSFTEDVPVRGGIAALSAAIPISPAPDRARFIAEAIRVVYSWPQAGVYSNEPMRRRIAAFLADAGGPRAPRSNDTLDEIPVPLTAAVWSEAVFHRTVSREDLAGAILADRSAALVCYSLAALDDETLQFFAGHTSLVARLAERAPAAFAAFGESVHVRSGRLAVPGGDAAAAAWESIAGETLDRPDRFLQQLFEADRGRLAYLFDVLWHLDPVTLSLTFRETDPGDALKRLAALARRGFPEWDIATAPFVRPPGDLSAFFARLRSTADVERGAALGTAAFWQKVFGDSTGASDAPADAAWLADIVVGRPAREREQRLDLFSFVGRVFGAASATDDIVAAAHGFGSYSVLMLTLERMGIRAPSAYVAAAQQAEKLTALDAARGTIALAQFQGSIALLAHLAAVHSIGAPEADALARGLFALRLDDSGYYRGAVAAWLGERVIAALPPRSADQTTDDVLLAGVAGPPMATSAARVEWEGQRYVVDPGGGELARLRRARERQQGVTFAAALGVAAAARRLAAAAPTLDAVRAAAATLDAAAEEIGAADRSAGDAAVRVLRETSRTLAAITRPADASAARRVAAPLAEAADALLGHALLSLAYACDLGDPDGTILIAGDPARRHDFGYGVPGRDARLRVMWSLPSIETRRGPWHLVGSVLALDVAMAPLALRRISVDRVPESPMINLMQRDGFAATVAVMNGAALSDAARDRIADHISDGRRRVERLAAGDAAVEKVAHDVDMDGWRARALGWTLAHDPKETASLFTLTELLALGGGSPAAFNPWGTYALRTAGCLCSRLAPPAEWRHWVGLSQTGLPATLVADLPLHVAVVLHNLHLPAVLAKPVLAAAMQDFVDATNPTDGNDWLTLARAAQAVDLARFEDYIAAATADGPLVADPADNTGK